jgi:hypothetical protein
MAIDWTAAFTNAAKFAPLATSIIAFVAVCFTATGVAIAWRSHREKTLAEFWRDFDKISIQYPELSVAGLVGEFDFKALVLDGSQEKFARCVVRFIPVLLHRADNSPSRPEGVADILR